MTTFPRLFLPMSWAGKTQAFLFHLVLTITLAILLSVPAANCSIRCGPLQQVRSSVLKNSCLFSPIFWLPWSSVFKTQSQGCFPSHCWNIAASSHHFFSISSPLSLIRLSHPQWIMLGLNSSFWSDNKKRRWKQLFRGVKTCALSGTTFCVFKHHENASSD